MLIAFVFWTQLTAMEWQGQVLLLISTVAIAFTMGYLAAGALIAHKLESRLDLSDHTPYTDINELVRKVCAQFTQQVRALEVSKHEFNQLRERIRTLETCLGGVSFYGRITGKNTLELTEVGDNLPVFFNVDKASFIANWPLVLKYIRPSEQEAVHSLLTAEKTFPERESMVFSLQRAAHETERYIKITVLRESRAGVLYITGVMTDVSELVIAGKKAESDDRAKSEFLATVSHELRTPLNAIIGFARLLKQQLHDQPGMENDAQTIVSSGEALHTILNDILDYSRIEAEGLRLNNQPFDLNELLSEVYQINKTIAKEKHVALNLINNLPPSPVLLGDRQRLRQILQNLLSNALKFTEDGFVEINATGNGPVNNRINLLITVRDSGIGISRQELNRLFKPFTQASRETNRRFGGTGLGLAISKGLAEQMGGTISVTSEPGVGSAFSLNLNLAISEMPKKGAQKVLNNTCPIKVLAVDDHPLNLKLIERFLSKAGHQVVVAESGQRAIELSESEFYDLILMDIDMPGMDGHEATERIRKSDGASKKSYICALSGLADEENIAKSLARGMNGHLTKPLSFDELTDLINKVSSEKCVGTTIVI